MSSGLAGWWPLNEWNGRANDLSGNGNHGSLVGGVAQGGYGPAVSSSYRFNATDSEVNCGDIGQITSKVSISVWYRPPTLPWGGNASNNGLVSKGSPAAFFNSTPTTGYHVGVNENDNSFLAAFAPSNNGGEDSLYLPAMSPNEWHHAVYTADANEDTISGYLDGEHIETVSQTVDDMSVTDSLGIGHTPNAGGGRYLQGQVADVRIYDRILSASEVKHLYDLGAVDVASEPDASDASAISRWTFDDPSDTATAVDSWGSNNGTINGATYNRDSIRGDSLLFDETTDDNVNVGDTADLSGLTNHTIGGWIKPTSATNNDLVSKFNQADSTAQEWLILYVDSIPSFRVHVSDGSSTTSLDSNFTPSTDTWYHVMQSYDGSTLKVYVNGVLDNQTTVTATIPDTTTPVRIGARQDGAGVDSTESMDGNIDDIRVYGRALSQQEIQEIYRWGTRGVDFNSQTVTR